MHGDRAWTYRELDEVTDRIARALLARGLPPEGIVAVVAERTLDWAASVLGILKAGAAYLPLEPHFPPDRIATVLTRAQARLVLGERGSTTTLDQALESLGASAPERLLVDDAVAEEHGDTVPRVEIAGDRLAYLYFTSGSTGEPKGAMCEHAGMVNHLYAKIEDLGITEGTVVTETAPQCFDISLWQLVAPWLVGGTTVLVEQETILDVPSFVDLLARRRVEVAQLVPSYLDVVVSYLEQQDVPAAEVLPALKRIAVTGEAVKKELVARWFSVRPDVAVVNAYGLTETCDDTNHEILTEVPAGERVPLGPAVPNVRVYVVDEALNPVPLGAPGEIVFSGVCVGRGYVNDPDRTAKAFVSDPLRPGERLYRSGDHGRWLPDGKLDFLGRRDHQVKISGFRIEIGEVENTLLRAPGVRDAVGGRRRAAGARQAAGRLLRRRRAGGDRGAARDPRRGAARLHGAAGAAPPGDPAAHPERQDRPQGADGAGARPRRARGPRRRRRRDPPHAHRGAGGRGLGAAAGRRRVGDRP